MVFGEVEGMALAGMMSGASGGRGGGGSGAAGMDLAGAEATDCAREPGRALSNKHTRSRLGGSG